MRTSVPVRQPAATLLLAKPLLRAYCLAYVYTTGPPLFKLLLSIYTQGSKGRQTIKRVLQVLHTSLDVTRFPFFCGALVGGSTFLQLPLLLFLKSLSKRISVNRRYISNSAVESLARFTAALFASWFSLGLLNSRIEVEKRPSQNETAVSSAETNSRLTTGSGEADGQTTQYSRLTAGRSIDLTLLVGTRAIETLIGDLWGRHKRSRITKCNWTSLEAFLSHYADAVVFALGSGSVMWAWFYLPYRLPHAYNQWIGEAAEVDNRLIETLRQAQRGEFVYGFKKEEENLLRSMCEDYGWPIEWSDPSKTIPIPCTMVHMHTGPSCHWHGIVRFCRGFKFAFTMYMPLQVLIRARHPSIRSLKSAIQDAIRSSTFLGAFVGLFYYSVCLSRTLVGPKIVPRSVVSEIQMDKGLCVAAGCLMCGWSILIETQKRWQEFAFFVAPRALATITPRQYERKYLWREQLAFSLSTATLFTYAQSDPEKVRGMLGKLLRSLLN